MSILDTDEIKSIREHLISRGLDPDRTGVVVDEKNKRACFFLYNLSGKLIGYQQYNPTGSKDLGHQKRGDESLKDLMKYYTYVSGHRQDKTKELAVWGLDSYKLDSPVLFIVEGVFDAVSLQNAKVSAIAILSNDPSPQMLSWLRTLPQKRIVIRDNDMAGNKLAKAGHVDYTVPSPYKDLNEMPQEKVNELVQQILQKEQR